MSAPVRLPAVAGRFYPGDAATVRAEAARLIGAPAASSVVAAGAVLPHAGWVYSGGVAGATLRRMAIPPRVVILCPNHTGRGAQIALVARGAFRVPGADVAVDEETAARILERAPGATQDLRAHEREHAIEVLLPLLVARRVDVRIVPMVVGGLDGAAAVRLGEGLAAALAGRGDDEVLVLASSDLSHYLPDGEARVRDRLALDRLLALDPEGLYRVCRDQDITMCGVLPATAMLAFARARGAGRAELVSYATSGDAYGDRDRVVGYAGVVVIKERAQA